MTPEEAQKAYDEAEAVPLSEERINEIVEYAVSGGLPGLKGKLDAIANRLVPVAGTLMRVATSNGRFAREPEIHEEKCDCQVCKAFVATQLSITELERIIIAIGERS